MVHRDKLIWWWCRYKLCIMDKVVCSAHSLWPAASRWSHRRSLQPAKSVQIDQILTEKWFVSTSSALQCLKSWTWAFSRLLPPFKPYSRARYLALHESVQLHFSCCSQYFIIFLIASKAPLLPITNFLGNVWSEPTLQLSLTAPVLCHLQ